jgi:hypothetical protein
MRGNAGGLFIIFFQEDASGILKSFGQKPSAGHHIESMSDFVYRQIYHGIFRCQHQSAVSFAATIGKYEKF